MNKQVKDYLDGLRNERRQLEIRIQEIDNELDSYGAGPAKVLEKCPECNGTGVYWDQWAGGIDCPACDGTGYKKSK